MLYLGTRDDQPIQNSAELSVEAVAPKADAVRQWFSSPVIRFVAAYRGCSCGFNYVIAEEPIACDAGTLLYPSDEEEQAVMRTLFALIQRHVVAGEVEMYPVWDGEERLPPKGTIELVATQLDPRTFFFNERFFYRVSSAAGR